MTSQANFMPAIRWKYADARVLLISVCLVVVAALVTVRSPAAMAGLLVFVVIWYAATARHPASVLALVRRLVPWTAIIIVLNAVLVPGDALFTIAGRRIASVQGAGDGVYFALRLGVMLVAASLLVAAVQPEGLALAVHDLLRRVSRRLADRVAFFTFLSMGFVPLFADEIARVRIAQSFRGGDLRGGMLRRAGSLRVWLVPVLMSAVRRSGELALAVELRETRARLVASVSSPRIRAADVVWFGLVAAAVIIASLPR